MKNNHITRKVVMLCCAICKKEFLVRWYRRKTAVVCSGHCRGIYVYRKFGHKIKAGLKASYINRPAWNKGVYMRLSPKTEFKKGLISWNKGLNYPGTSPETEFKHEPRPDKRLPVGKTTIIGKKRVYVMVKIKEQSWKKNGVWVQKSLGKWESKARAVWEKYRGPIPKGFVVYKKDGNVLNCRVSNLECFSRAELLRRNSRGRLGLL